MNLTVLEYSRRAASGGIEGKEQLMSAVSSNGTCQFILVEPTESMQYCMTQTVIIKGQAFGGTGLYPSFPIVSESTLEDIEIITYFLEQELQSEKKNLN